MRCACDWPRILRINTCAVTTGGAGIMFVKRQDRSVFSSGITGLFFSQMVIVGTTLNEVFGQRLEGVLNARYLYSLAVRYSNGI